MPPQNKDNVWISREEYDRLRAATQQATETPTVSTDYYTATVEPSPTAAKNDTYQTALAVVFGMLLIYSLLASINKLAETLIIIFLGYAVYGVFKHFSNRSSAVSALPAATPKSTSQKILKIVAIIAALIVIVPVLVYGAMIILFIALISAGGGRGS